MDNHESSVSCASTSSVEKRSRDRVYFGLRDRKDDRMVDEQVFQLRIRCACVPQYS